MAMIYSFSHLQKGDRHLHVQSTYVHNGDFDSYVIRVVLMRDKHAVYARDRASFGTIYKAERFHQDQVLHFVDKGYDIVCSSCK